MREDVYGTMPADQTLHGVEVQAGVHRRISWGAIVAGMVMTLAIQLILSLLGLGIGMTTVEPAQNGGTPGLETLSSSAGIWWTVSYMVALAVGGYVAARLAGVVVRGDGVLHGLVTWALALLLGAWLVTTAIGGVLGGAFTALGSMVSGAGSAIEQVAPEALRATGITPEQFQDQARRLLQPGNPQPASPEEARSEMAGLLTTMATGTPEQARAATDRAVTVIAEQAGIPEDQARQRLDALRGQIQQTQQRVGETATRTAQSATDALSAAGIWGTVGLLLGAIAAMIGGAIGTRRPEETVLLTHR